MMEEIGKGGILISHETENRYHADIGNDSDSDSVIQTHRIRIKVYEVL